MKSFTYIMTGLLLCVATTVSAAYPEGYVLQPHDHIIKEVNQSEGQVIIEDGSTWSFRQSDMLANWEAGDVVRVMDLNPYPGDEMPEYTIVMMNIGREEQSEVKEAADANPHLLPKIVKFENNVVLLDNGAKLQVPNHLASRAEDSLVEGGNIAIRRTLTWAYSYLLFTENGTELQAKSID